MVDRLLLLERGGETVYFGDIGPDSRILREYFARHGAICPPDMNPAEFMLEAIGAGVTPRIGDRDWKDIWLDSPECRQAREEIVFLKSQGLKKSVSDRKTMATCKLGSKFELRINRSTRNTTDATPFFYQLKTVVSRNNLALWRSPDYVFSRLFVHLFISLFVSLSLLQLKNSVRDLQYRVSIYLIPTLCCN